MNEEERRRIKRKPEFDLLDRGYRIRAWYQTNSSDAIVRIDKNHKRLRYFTFPSYKIWNLAAHFSDIVDGEIQKSIEGYMLAASDGLGGFAPIKEQTR